MKPIAIAFVHGMAIDDPGFAEAMEKRLEERFSALVGRRRGGASGALVSASVHWSPVVEPLERDLLGRLIGREAGPLYEELRRQIGAVNRGSTRALLPLLTSFLPRWPGRGGLSYAALRWIFLHFVGDAIAYQMTPANREIYDAVHAAYAAALRELAEKAGPAAPLCVIAHSLGTVISSNFLYDLEKSPSGSTPLERGETLTLLYTLGSPLALWTLRYPSRELDRPVSVPSPSLTKHHPMLSGEWVNFHDPEDVIASPLRSLSPSYAKAVTRDLAVRAGRAWVSRTPLSHPYYWSTDAVIERIAHALVDTWRKLNDGGPLR